MLPLTLALLSEPPPETAGALPGWLVLISLAALYGAGYAISLRLHPYKACRRCRGSGKHRGWFFTDAFRACDACSGTGRELRRFARDD
ncbi:hypothetical protein [Planobispora takensis]|uniref:Uncharacterized protein n=1 Tax=Planobispora takensis TaxID=1367882 RepID=A0A8J3T757_9ACTN|nr:hypothetical protein [Planobispora takensis]GII05460.1 hypothetical protein Pta02_74680 [Planobispora takensis]